MNTENPTSSMGRGFDWELVNRNVKQASSILKAMSNPHRLLVICQLPGGEKSVGDWRKSSACRNRACPSIWPSCAGKTWSRPAARRRPLYYSLDGDETARIIDTLHDIFAEANDASPFGADGSGRGRAAVG